MSSNSVVIVIPIELAWLGGGIMFYLIIGVIINSIVWPRHSCLHHVMGAIYWPLALLMPAKWLGSD